MENNLQTCIPNCHDPFKNHTLELWKLITKSHLFNQLRNLKNQVEYHVKYLLKL